MTIGRVAYDRKILDLDEVSEATALSDIYPPLRVQVVMTNGRSHTLDGPVAQAVWMRLLDGAVNLTPSEPVAADVPAPPEANAA